MMWAQQQPQQVPYNPNGPQTGVVNPHFPGAYENQQQQQQRDNPFDDEKRAQEYEDVKV